MHKQSQKMEDVKDRENTEHNVRAFIVEEDDWNFEGDRWSAAKMVKPERNFQLGRLEQVVIREKNFELVPVISYRERRKIVILRRLAVLEAKNTPEQKAMEANLLKEDRDLEVMERNKEEDERRKRNKEQDQKRINSKKG